MGQPVPYGLTCYALAKNWPARSGPFLIWDDNYKT